MKHHNADFWIEKLSLLPHPEGGYYRETYRAAEMISQQALPSKFDGQRNFSTAIYFLLRAHDISHFHRIKSDELWHFHAGSPLSIYVLHDHKLEILKLGANPDEGESLQIVVKANRWFGACVHEGGDYTLAGCTVAPGFDFRDFEMATRENLLQEFPGHHHIIKKLTH